MALPVGAGRGILSGTRKRYPRPRLYHIAVLIGTGRSYGRQIIRGIGDYARIHGPWLFHLPIDGDPQEIPPKEEWAGDGIIAQPKHNERFVQQLAKCRLPTVTLSGPPGVSGLPSVLADQQAVAELAMAHFRERGFVRFAYCAIASERFWPPTGELFRKLAEEKGQPCDVYQPAYDPRARTLRLAHLGEWLKSLRKPVGLLAGNDLRAREVLDACRLAGLNVPEAVAVLGVNDDELICELANPPLSSVMHNARRIGYEAAALLHRMLNGEKCVEDVRVPPLGVHTRQSTDLLAIEDPEIATAVRFIRENACQGICVQEVLDQVALSRRSFEMRFRKAIGRPPHEEIRRVQLERVKTLLLQTDYTLERIAELTGFSTAQYLAGLFRRVMKTTPGTFRREARVGSRDHA